MLVVKGMAFGFLGSNGSCDLLMMMTTQQQDNNLVDGGFGVVNKV